jgi:hypothetical protein
LAAIKTVMAETLVEEAWADALAYGWFIRGAS